MNYRKTYDAPLPTIPDDLAALIAQLKDVQRFGHPNYPVNVFHDNVFEHVCRCITFLNQLEIDDDMRNIMTRMLWIHDIPEIFTKDYTVLQKIEDPELVIRLDQEEAKIVADIFTPSDQVLMRDFNQASAFWKGKSDIKTSVAAKYVKLIDHIDGIITFHWQLTDWIMTSKYKEELLPPRAVFNYSFDQFALWNAQLKLMPASHHREQLSTIATLCSTENAQAWRRVTPNRRHPLFS